MHPVEKLESFENVQYPRTWPQRKLCWFQWGQAILEWLGEEVNDDLHTISITEKEKREKENKRASLSTGTILLGNSTKRKQVFQQWMGKPHTLGM